MLPQSSGTLFAPESGKKEKFSAQHEYGRAPYRNRLSSVPAETERTKGKASAI